MLSLIHPLWQRLEFLAVPCIAGSFWALAVLVQVKLQGEPLVLGAMLVGCLLLLGFCEPSAVAVAVLGNARTAAAGRPSRLTSAFPQWFPLPPTPSC